MAPENRSRSQEHGRALTSSVVEGRAREQWRRWNPNPIPNPILNPNSTPIPNLISDPNPVPNPISNSIPNPIPKKDSVLSSILIQDSINPNPKKDSGSKFYSHPRQRSCEAKPKECQWS